ncbi:MAG: hypothetical protein QF780_00950 [Candidatus Marinimicrobia bacterium]|nr:hypothetical protein [Candidatus Neomarinimicrobiota bacterium]
MDIEYIHPSNIMSEPINYYSLIHFIEYSLLSLLGFINMVHVLIISVLWEVIELFVAQDWARESWANKGFDIIFNFSGFFIGRIVFRSYFTKNSISI